MLYADDITITSTHTSMSAAKKYIQPYLHKVCDWTQHNNLIINPDKTTCTLFTPDPAEYNSNLGLNINNKALPMALHPKVLGLTLDPKLTYNAHIQNIATHAQKPLQVIKALTGTTWGKQKETLVATYKAVMRPTLEYASSIWSPMASPTSINKLQVMQNAALRGPLYLILRVVSLKTKTQINPNWLSETNILIHIIKSYVGESEVI